MRPEAFWALKLQAGRRQDIADLFVIRAEPVQLRETREAFEALWSPRLMAKLTGVLASLDQKKTYEDALSRQATGSPRASRNR